MKKIALSLYACWALGTSAFAQLSDNTTPMSFSPYFEQVIESKNTLARLEIPSLDMEFVKREAKEGRGANYFARPIFVDYNLQNAGRWDELPNGDRIWRLKVHSKGALSLHALFDKFYLPKGGRLYAYNPQRTQVSGGYTEANNHPSGEFSFSPVPGDELVMEYFEPAEVRGQGFMHIYRIEYAYAPIPVAQDPNRPSLHFGFGTSQTCHKNVNCTEGDNWQVQKRSVVQMLMAFSNGTSACTGALMNNDQLKPYILSAWHCQDAAAGVTALYNQWNFAFNWEAPTCSNPTSLAKTQTLTGCSHKVAGNNSDYFLFELNSSPPASYNVFYAGWDRTGTTPTAVTGIHHPAADIKKISVNTTNAIGTNQSGVTFGGGATDLVIPAGNLWSFLWNVGTTEGGSSGSPLFDQNKRVIGTLTGGSSSCTNMTGGNYYGRMNIHWPAIQPYLSSDNANRTVMDGYDPNAVSVNTGVSGISTAVNLCLLNNNTSVKLVIRNYGSTAQNNVPYSWTLTHPTAATQTGNGTVSSLAALSSADVFVNVDMSLMGTYTLTATTSTPSDENSSDDSRTTTFANSSASVAAKNISFVEGGDVFKLVINFTKGDGAERLVLLKQGSSFTNADLPVQGQSYSANPIFGFGSKIGGAYVVYKGTAESASILDGLSLNANYYVAVVEYSCNNKYLLGDGVAYSSKVYTANEQDYLGGLLKVYPNPVETGKRLTVELATQEKSTWEIQTLQGRTVQSGNFTTNEDKLQAQIALNKQGAGMYLLRVQTGKHLTIRKIVVK